MVCTCFAAGLDWLEGLVPAFFVLFWILSQVFGLVRRVAKPVIPKQPVQGPVEIVDVRVLFEREIEKIKQLQEAQRRAAQQADSPVRAEEGRRVSEVRRVKRRDEPRRSAATRESASPPPLPKTRQQPTAGASSVISQRVGSGIAKHVEEAFAHDLAHASVSTQGEATPNQATAPLAAEVAGMLRDPVSIRRAILIRELLERPTDRW